MSVTSPARATVLVIEDDAELRLAIERFLDRGGFSVHTAATGRDAVAAAEATHPDVIVLDIGLPDQSGLDVMSALRATGPVPILLLTGRHTTADRVEGLDRGADDYLVKPASLHELAARLRALLRRHPPAGVLTIGDVSVDVRTRQVHKAGEEVHLTRLEFDLLVHILQRPGEVIARAELLEQVWHSSTEFQDVAVITEYVLRLRRKLGALPIVSIRGIGYRYDPEATSCR